MRFVEVRGQDDEWMVVDLKGDDARVVCFCYGFKAPLNAQYICQALEQYHSTLYEAMGLKDAMGSLD